MATKDFRASQIETSKIIGTGSISGTTAGIAIYSGSIASNREGGTSDSAMFDNVGSDVFLFVSGTISNSDNTRTDATLFGGDVVISGTLYAERQVIEVDSVADGDFFVTGNMYVKPDTNSDVSVAFRKADGTDVLKVNTNSPNVNINGALILTGNIHMLSDNFDGVNIETENTFELKAQNNIVMKLDSDNDSPGDGSYFGVRDGAGNYKFIVYENSATYINYDMSSTTDFIVKGDTNHSAIFVDASEDAVALGRFLSTAFGSESGVGDDVKILLSGTVGSRGGTTRGATLNAGDLIVSGASDIKSNLSVSGSIETTGDISLLANSSLRFNNPGQNDQFINGNNATITLDADDGIILKGDSYIYHNINDTIDNIFSTTQTVFNFNRDDIDFRVNTDDYYGTLFVDANDNTIILGNESFDVSPIASEVSGYGDDVKILLSGTVGSKDTSTRGVTLVSGDMVVSGTIYDGVGNQIGDITSVTAGNGLTGGGSSGAVSLAVGAGTGIDVTSTTVSVDVSDFMTNGVNNRILTATGTDAMNAETNLTFEGGSSPPELYIGGMAMVDNGVRDKFSTITNATGVTSHDCRDSLVFLHSSISANFTANFTSLNLDQDYATNITLVLTQGGTAYMSTAVQIEGVAQTILWQGGLTPSGTSSGTDVVSFSIINKAGTYTVLGQSVSYS